MQQQHLMQMQPMMAAYYPTNVTTDHIQQVDKSAATSATREYESPTISEEMRHVAKYYLDENKSLILKIVENQNSGKLSECAENQARLQRNLMYLAAIADSQPQPPTMHSQYPGGGVLQPGAHYMQQHQQAQQMASPQSLMAARSSMFYGAQPYPSLQQQQASSLHGQLGMSSAGSSGLMLQGEPHSAGQLGGGGGGGFPDFFRGDGLHGGARALAGGSKQDNVSAAEGRGGSNGTGGETHYLKRAAED